MEDFLRTENIQRYLGLLSGGVSEHMERTLLDLLLREETQLGRNREQLELARQRVSDGRARIERLTIAMGDGSRSGDERANDEALLITWTKTQSLLEHHANILEKLIGDKLPKE
jgi:hypothetical protein